MNNIIKFFSQQREQKPQSGEEGYRPAEHSESCSPIITRVAKLHTLHRLSPPNAKSYMAVCVLCRKMVFDPLEAWEDCPNPGKKTIGEAVYLACVEGAENE